MTQHITIGSEFFQKAKKDYSDWHWAVIREFFQNGIDCGSSNIWVTCDKTDGKITLAVRNDGEVMSKEVLIDSLLCLGGSAKNFDGDNTGGFGKAKEILYFCHNSYRIHSGNLIVEGNGATYELIEGDYINGTESTIVIDDDVADELHSQFNTFCFYGQWRGTFYWNGVAHKADMHKGSPRRSLDFGTVYSNKSTEHMLVVRVNGIPMFTQSTDFDRCVVVELSGNSDEILTSNRDGLIWDYRSELSDFITELAVDKRSALRSRQQHYRHYDGSRLCHRSVQQEDQQVAVSDILQIDDLPEPELESKPEVKEYTGDILEVVLEVAENQAACHAPTERIRVSVGDEFVIKNETDLVVPTYYRPDESDFSDYSRKLTRIWGRLMLQMHRLFDHESEFAVGFIFSEDPIEAEFEDGQFGKVYYISPAKLIEQTYTYSKSWKKRFKLTERGRHLSIAAHEFVHGLGYNYHDENYANKLTDVLATIMDNRKQFNWCWK
jgi:hypothetical protein